MMKVVCRCLVLLGLLAVGRANVLDDYVNAPDPSYRWELANTVDGAGYKLYILKLVSQTWLSTAIIDRPVWEHWLRICVPDGIDSNLAALYIEGGGNPLGSPPSDMQSFLVDVALKTKIIFAELNQIPNQPIVWADEGISRSEDSLLAKSWDDFIKTRDGYRIARLAMVKAAVRALDAVTEFTRSAGIYPPTQFAVSGGSKRGWTAWLHGAVDKRVIAVAPIVSEILSIQENINFLWQVYGRWPAAFGDYTALNLTQCLNCPVFGELASIEDPYVYLDRYRERQVPILSVSATGDEFFLPDGYQFWYPRYIGSEKYLAIQPNAEHSMFNRIDELSATLGSYVWTFKKGLKRPQFEWTLSDDGSTIVVQTVDTPISVRSWEAYNPRSRSFIANCYLTCLWRPTVLESRGNNTYVASYAIPTSGYRGFFVELQFDVDSSQEPLTITTGTSFIPKALPYPPCGSDCAQCDRCNPLPAEQLAKIQRFQPF